MKRMNNFNIRILFIILIIIAITSYLILLVCEKDVEIIQLKNDIEHLNIELVHQINRIKVIEDENDNLDMNRIKQHQALFQSNATAHKLLDQSLKKVIDLQFTNQYLEQDVKRLEELYRKGTESQLLLEHHLKDREHPIIPIVLLTCNRSFYLGQCLKALERSRKQSSLGRQYHPIIVSQDCDDILTDNLLHLEDEYIEMEMCNWRQPNRTRIIYPYEAIARHYRWILAEVFKLFKVAIILEDDLEVSPDFIDYFDRMYSLLTDKKQNLYCVSAWNDVGHYTYLPDDPSTLVNSFKRTDFFPGLGWMLTREFWQEIRDEWPSSYWDDYLRLKNITRGRHCIYPDIPRVKNIGRLGTSGEVLYEGHLSKIISNNITNLNYQNMSLQYLNNETYKKEFYKVFNKAMKINYKDLESLHGKDQSYKIEYENVKEYSQFATKLGLLNDTMDGMPRSSYDGIVQLYYKSNIVYLAPKIK